MLASALQPSVRRTGMMRYKTLWEGSNQAQADGLLAWERVLRAQAQPDTATGGEPVFKRTDLTSEPVDDVELDDLTRRFHKLQNDIRTNLVDENAPRPLLPLLPAEDHLALSHVFYGFP